LKNAKGNETKLKNVTVQQLFNLIDAGVKKCGGENITVHHLTPC